MIEGQVRAESASGLHVDAMGRLAVGEDGFQLRIALEAFRHIAHGRPGGVIAGHVPRPILALAGLVEVLPPLHEAVGAALRIGAQLRFELKGVDGPVDAPRACFTGEAVVLSVGGFRIMPAAGSDLIECAPCRAKLAPLFIRRCRALLLGFKDRIGRAGMADGREVERRSEGTRA